MSKKEKEQVNTRSVERAIRELRGLNGEGDADNSHWYEPIEGTMEDGVRIITYSTNAPAKKAYLSHGVTRLIPVHHPEHIAEVSRALKQVESFANVKFKQLSGMDAGQAEIVIFLGHGRKFKVGGYANTHGKQRDIVVKPNHFNYAFTHELGHALGLSHPDHATEKNSRRSKRSVASGNSPAYNEDGTIMSYRGGQVDDGDENFGPYDIAALQSMYGKPKNTSPHQVIQTDKGVPSTIYSEEPVSLMVSDKSPESFSDIALPNVTDDKLRLFEEQHRLAFGTQIANILADESRTKPLDMMGNTLPNTLRGGSGDDRLTTKGHNDMLTGGKGRDAFVLSAHSKHNHITDLSPVDGDQIVLPKETKNVQLDTSYRYNKEVTLLFARDEHHALISSAIIYEQRPKDVAKTLKSHASKHTPLFNIAIDGINTTGMSSDPLETKPELTSISFDNVKSKPVLMAHKLDGEIPADISLDTPKKARLTKHEGGLGTDIAELDSTNHALPRNTPPTALSGILAGSSLTEVEKKRSTFMPAATDIAKSNPSLTMDKADVETLEDITSDRSIVRQQTSIMQPNITSSEHIEIARQANTVEPTAHLSKDKKDKKTNTSTTDHDDEQGQPTGGIAAFLGDNTSIVAGIGAAALGIVGFFISGGTGLLIGSFLGLAAALAISHFAGKESADTTQHSPKPTTAHDKKKETKPQALGIQQALDGKITHEELKDLTKPLVQSPHAPLFVLPAFSAASALHGDHWVVLTPEATEEDVGAVIIAQKLPHSNRLRSIHVALSDDESVRVKSNLGFTEKDADKILAAARDSRQSVKLDHSRTDVDDIRLTLNYIPPPKRSSEHTPKM